MHCSGSWNVTKDLDGRRADLGYGMTKDKSCTNVVNKNGHDGVQVRNACCQSQDDRFRSLAEQKARCCIENADPKNGLCYDRMTCCQGACGKPGYADLCWRYKVGELHEVDIPYEGHKG